MDWSVAAGCATRQQRKPNKCMMQQQRQRFHTFTLADVATSIHDESERPSKLGKFMYTNFAFCRFVLF